ncbi:MULTISPECIES: RebB family R body protein [unclassified Azospirillum]|uniref:RebB family R body protein n=1 Tax=unclassified Azospirillum TaxID=2630922 RepID=UPI000B6465E5|nr:MULTISPECIES: RebB family R body protein [unclassified Azospirillum]SNR85077.1 Killing trait domain-containing protein [Azospirillum sp. RU38E]SNS00976.1 Killing trait domain-containing protein [Azospirillum sp. RU37A]
MSGQPVNAQITDAVTQSNVKVVGDAPAVALGSLSQVEAHSTGIQFENAASAQQNMQIPMDTMGVTEIYSIDKAAAAAATERVAQTGVADNLTSLLTVLNAFKGGNGQS